MFLLVLPMIIWNPLHVIGWDEVLLVVKDLITVDVGLLSVRQNNCNNVITTSKPRANTVILLQPLVVVGA